MELLDTTIRQPEMWILGVIITVMIALISGIWIITNYVVKSTTQKLEIYLDGKLELFNLTMDNLGKKISNESKRIDRVKDLILSASNGLGNIRIENLKNENLFLKDQDALKGRVNTLENGYSDLKIGQKELVDQVNKLDKSIVILSEELKKSVKP